MRKLLLLAFVILAVQGFGQRVYFVYFQSENGKPFSVYFNEKLYNSSQAGYLIVSKLEPKSYTAAIKFNAADNEPVPFNMLVENRDYGYFIKEPDGKMVLQNIQTKETIYTTTDPNAIKTVQKEVSRFTDVLSKASNNPTLKEEIVQPPKPVEKEVPKETPPVVKEQEVVVKKGPVVVPEKKIEQTENTAIHNEVQPEKQAENATITTEVKPSAPPPSTSGGIPAPEYVPSTVNKRFENSTTAGLGITYSDVYSNGIVETITIFIPEPKLIKNTDAVADKPADNSLFLEKKEVVEKKVAPVIKEKNEETKPVDKEPAVQNTSADKPVAKNTNKNCKETADEQDFIKLRKKMIGEDTDEDMLSVAAKAFKLKCYTSEQVKNLSVIFLTDEGKYKIFDAAFPYVWDQEKYATIDSGIKDEYFLRRFKSILP